MRTFLILSIKMSAEINNRIYDNNNHRDGYPIAIGHVNANDNDDNSNKRLIGYKLFFDL